MSLIKLLDNPFLWELSRYTVEATLSLYKKRIGLMNDWGLLAANPTVLDVGCGTGHYAHITDGEYLGIDLNEQYIERARILNGGDTKRFKVMSVNEVSELNKEYDLILMVDILHHIAQEQCKELLTSIARMTTRHVVSFEPLLDQTNPVGRWMIRSDRGKYMRSARELHELLIGAGLDVIKTSEMNNGMVYRTAGFLCASRNG